MEQSSFAPGFFFRCKGNTSLKLTKSIRHFFENYQKKMLPYYYIAENQRDNKIHSPKKMHKKIRNHASEFYGILQNGSSFETTGKEPKYFFAL